MTLKQFTDAIGVDYVPPNHDEEQTLTHAKHWDLTQDSRQVGSAPHMIYAALPGAKVHGLDFLDQALEQGANALLLPRFAASKRKFDVPVLVSDDVRSSFAHMAAYLYGPTKQNPIETRVAITGTNGKTSIAYFLRQLLMLCGRPAASAGTLGLMPEGYGQLPPLTTPDPVALFKAMRQIKAADFKAFVMEASSHGLAQRRLDGFAPNIAVFSNLSQDHLDYHHGMTAYAEAKFRLFKELLTAGGTQVFSLDQPFSQRLMALGKKSLTYGFSQGADIRVLKQSMSAKGQALQLDVMGEREHLQVAQIGAFQGENLVACLGAALAAGLDWKECLKHMENLQSVPGRMEVTATKAKRMALVDYAHTPDALRAACAATRPHVEGKLHLVVGAGGDRDKGKRPLMGAVAARMADITYVTDDNPRSEDPNLIRRAVVEGAQAFLGNTAKGDQSLFDVPDRRQAIERALGEAEAGDIVLIAGKGHEPYQEIAGVQLPFDDRAISRELALALW